MGCRGPVPWDASRSTTGNVATGVGKKADATAFEAGSEEASHAEEYVVEMIVSDVVVDRTTISTVF